MARVVLLLLLMAPFSAARAAPPATPGNVTVEQLDQWIAANRNDRDGKVARQLAGMKLTERADAGRMAKWEAALPGIGSREALMAMADAAAFLGPAVTEIPNSPTPDGAAQRQILSRMTDYVKQVMPRLPNFIAQRNTTAFQITTEERLLSQLALFRLSEMGPERLFPYHALGPVSSSGSAHVQLFWTGSYVQTVNYRGGLGVADLPPGAAGHTPFSLDSEGEFGSILAVILVDTPKGKIDWSHWEQGTAGSLAIFRYSVPSADSHFAVEFSRGHEPDFPAYRGEIAIDPTNGAIFRLTIQANMRDASSIYEVSTLVEFGPVPIGGMTYISPVRSVTIAAYFDPHADLDAQPPPIPYQTSINDVTFTGHHIFRTKARIVTGAADDK
jgi:hypothetical protein